MPPLRKARGRRPLPQEAHRVNSKITASEVRVIGEDGKQLGIMPTHIAVRIAKEKSFDLVEVNPKGEPPVCKIIDYGRFKYEEAKKKRANKRKQAVVQVKEIKLRPKTDTHDLDVKVRAILRFLAEGNKARLVIQFRGREIVHPEMGKAVLQKVLTELGDYAVVEQWPVMEGRRMNMLVAPRPGVTFPSSITRDKSSTETKDDPAKADGVVEASTAEGGEDAKPVDDQTASDAAPSSDPAGKGSPGEDAAARAEAV